MNIVIEVIDGDDPIMMRTTNDWEAAKDMIEILHEEYERKYAEYEDESALYAEHIEMDAEEIKNT